MNPPVRRRPITPLALAASLIAATLVLFSPLSASAHDALVSSSPEADSTVETLPATLTLTFSEDLIAGDGGTAVTVTDAAGASVTVGDAVVDGPLVTQQLVAEAEAGVYKVVWRVVSSDGHPTSGEYSFTVTTSTIPAPTAEPTTSAAPTPTETAQPAATSTPVAAEEQGDTAGFWVLGAIGVLIVAAVVIVLLTRRRGAGAADSGSPSER